MARPELTRRRTQLEILSDACRCRRCAHIAARCSPANVPPAETRLLAVEPEGVLVLARGDNALGTLAPGSAVTVSFEHKGVQYAFTARTRGPARPPATVDAEEGCWRLSLPLCVERQRQRAGFRAAWSHGGPLEACLHGVLKPHLFLRVRVTDISAGGFEGLVERERAARLEPGELFWADLKLPGMLSACEYVVRLDRPRPAPAGSPDAVVRWQLCPGDDPSMYRRSLARLKRGLAGHLGSDRKRPAAHPESGR